MAEQPSREAATSRGDRRDDDRRSNDRRRTDRRTPLPPWRRPWALVAYGVLGALLVVGVFAAVGGDDAPERAALVTAPPPAPTGAAPQSTGAPREAFSDAAFEQLVLEGNKLAGQRVLAELSCAPPAQIGVNQVDRVEPAVAAIREADGRVPAAECKWGVRGEARQGDFLLLVPPELSEEFSSAPVITDEFVRRRRFRAEVEWIGRSEALALRTAGVLRRVF